MSQTVSNVAPNGVPCEVVSREDANKMLKEITREKISLENEVSEIERQLEELEYKESQLLEGIKRGDKQVAIGPVCVACRINIPDVLELCPPCHYRIQILLTEGKNARQIAQQNRELFAIIECQRSDILRTVAE